MQDRFERHERPGPAWAEQLVRFLDDGLRLPGTTYRIGCDGIVGLLFPGAGDALAAVGALSLFGLALQRSVPRVVLAHMALNIGIDALIGIVPLVGDLFDFAWKANRKNLRLIEREQAAPRSRSLVDYLVIGVVGLLIVAVISLPFLLTGLLIAKLRQSC
jgi:hypothetical protein